MTSMTDDVDTMMSISNPIDGPLRYALQLADQVTPSPAAAHDALCILRNALADSLGIEVQTLMMLAGTSDTGCFAEMAED